MVDQEKLLFNLILFWKKLLLAVAPITKLEEYSLLKIYFLKFLYLTTIDVPPVKSLS